ncbi:DoxX family protein [Antarctobacter heliothermus]|uniref:Putative oxidoreductase n=1 Tax=Antarctobacter heliothermus TaxID=74033 RepID=A0A239HBH7_9RHOB|nr:DoxX family protein [Antarctobacter heliothermus]SNS78632.1 putative oxidoreductase [Antarctobacter heliothermus]
MDRLLSLHHAIFAPVERLGGSLIPLLARLVFAATLLRYYWNSAGTKVWDRKGEEGIFDFFTLEPGTYAQMFPKAFEAAGYNPAKMGVLYDIVAYAGTYAEWVLPLLIVIGLFTRLAALGMIGFVVVQTFVDVTGHGGEPGMLFDTRYELIDERTLWIFGFVVLVIKGAGVLSIDRLLGLNIAPRGVKV